MGKKGTKQAPLERGILDSMKAIDNQIAREMQRSPAELKVAGVQKWKPYTKRIENITSFVMEQIGTGEIHLDSLLVFSQAYAKCLKFLIEDLESSGLGEIRSAYCDSALESVNRDTLEALNTLRGEQKTH